MPRDSVDGSRVETDPDRASRMAEERIDHLSNVDDASAIQTYATEEKDCLCEAKRPPSPKNSERFTVLDHSVERLVVRDFTDHLGHVQGAKGRQDTNQHERDGCRDEPGLLVRRGKLQDGGARQGVDGNCD